MRAGPSVVWVTGAVSSGSWVVGPVPETPDLYDLYLILLLTGLWTLYQKLILPLIDWWRLNLDPHREFRGGLKTTSKDPLQVSGGPTISVTPHA